MVKISKNTRKSSHRKEGKIRKKQNEQTVQTKFLQPILFSVVLFVGSIFFIPDKFVLINNQLFKNTFYLFSLVLTAFLFYSLLFKNKPIGKDTAKYTFLALLLLNIVSSLSISAFQGTAESIIFNLQIYSNFALFPMTIFGLVAILLHKDQIAPLFDKNEKAYLKKQNLFSIYNIAFFTLVVISGLLLFYKLGYFDFWSDEKQVVMAGYGHYKSGEYKYWDFIKDKIITNTNYNRGKPHIVLLSWVYSIFDLSEWSSRFVSAFFGLVLAISGYFIMNFFTRNRLVSLLSILTILLNVNFLLHFRWTRMYAILIPTYLLVFYFMYRGITEQNLFRNKLLQPVNKYFNFHFLFLFIALIILLINDQVHRNGTMITLVVFVFIIYKAIKSGNKRFIISASIGIFTILAFYFSGLADKYTSRMTFFEGKRYIYLDILFNYPLKTWLNISILLLGAVLFYFIKDNKQKNKLVYIYLNTIIVAVLFIYIVFFGVSFRYVSFAIPILIMLIFLSFYFISKLLFNKYIHILLLALVLSSGFIHFSHIYAQIYEKNIYSPAWPSKGYDELIETYKPGEPIFTQYVNPYYLDDIDTSAFFVDMSRKKNYQFSRFIEDINKYDSGWMTWYTFNEKVHINSLIASYANLYFDKLHGKGIDHTGVELYHFKKDQIKDPTIFKQEQFWPTASLSLKKSFSIAFWLRSNSPLSTPPFVFSDTSLLSIINPDKSGNKLIFKPVFSSQNNAIESSNLTDGNWHNIVWIQEISENKPTHTLFVDGFNISSKLIDNKSGLLTKLKLNATFTGELNDIRIYDFSLEKQHVKSIYNNGSMTFNQELYSGQKAFNTIYHWTKQN